jgi:hypothetical protein
MAAATLEQGDLKPLTGAGGAGGEISLEVSPRERSKWPAPARRSHYHTA